MRYTGYDRENAPTQVLTEPLTEALIRREHHRIATLGRNRIIRDHYKTQALSGRERVTVLLPKTKRPRQFNRMISAAIRKIFGILYVNILATRKEKS